MDFDLEKYRPMPAVPCNYSTHRVKFWFFAIVLPVALIALSISGAYALFDEGLLRNIIGGGCSIFVFCFFVNYADKLDKQYQQDCQHFRGYLIELNSDISYYESELDRLPSTASPSERRRISLHLDALRRILSDFRSRIPSGSDWSAS